MDFICLLDFYIRYIRDIFSLRIKGYIAITDRYVYDMLMNEDIHPIFKKTIYKLYPLPDCVIYLYASTATICRRRKISDEEKLAWEMHNFENIMRALDVQNIFSVRSDEIEDTLAKIPDIMRAIGYG